MNIEFVRFFTVFLKTLLLDKRIPALRNETAVCKQVITSFFKINRGNGMECLEIHKSR